MEKIFRFFAERHLLAIIFTVVILLLGVRAISDVQREELPAVNFDIMWVFVAYPNASPEDVEINVTNKIEDELKGLSGVDYYESVSNENSSFVLLVTFISTSSGEALGIGYKNPHDIKIDSWQFFPLYIANCPNSQKQDNHCKNDC